MRQYFLQIILLILLLFSTTKAENYKSPDGYDFEVNLKPEKTSIMLKEPVYFDFEIENISDANLGVVVGGDYRNEFGRPDSFEVKVVDSKGEILPKPKTMTLGGIIGVQKITIGKTYNFRLYLPHWATIENLGSYNIQVEKDLFIGKYDENHHLSILNAKKSVRIHLTAKIKVIPLDYQKMGVIVDEIGKQLVQGDDTAQRLAPFILDDRIIKYLIDAVEKNFWLMRYLSKFNNEQAFKAIISKINDPRDEVRRNVSVSLSLSAHPKAPDHLLLMRKDKNAAIRLDVVHFLGKSKTIESSKILKEMLNDEDKWVRAESKRYLTERGEKLN